MLSAVSEVALLVANHFIMSTMQNQVAIVTGGAGAIGKAIAVALLSQGATVVITGRTASTLQATKDELKSDNLHIHAMDVSKEDDVINLFQSVKEKFGTCNLLVNNAGMAIAGDIMDLTASDMEKVLQVNVVGPFVCAREFLKLYKDSPVDFKDPRRIINIGSIAAISPRPNSAPYTTSKFAMLGLNQSLALDARAYGVGVGIVHPGNVPSGLYTPEVIASREETEGFCSAEDIAACVLTMAMMPPNSNVLELTVLPTKQPLVGRG